MAEAGNSTIGGALLAAYLFGGRLAAPLLAGVYAWRARRGKEDPERRGERFGRTRHARPAGDLVWVHAASVGETNAVLPLIEWIARRGLSVLLTTGTLTSAKLAAKRLPRGAIHQYFPFDAVPMIDRFLDHWRPCMAITVESEVWPAMLTRLRQRRIPVVVVNGRLSAASFRGWRRFGGSARGVFSALSLCLAQSERDAKRFARLGVGDVRVVGNLKFDVAPLGADADQLRGLRQVLGARPVWMAASTHDGEEVIVARLHSALRAQFPGLLLICAPRHPERGRGVAEVFAQQGHDVSVRSLGHAIRPGTSVYVADTIGEMGLFYRLAAVTFVGGSLVPRGGQNPIEPAQLGCAVVSGPSTRNFSKIYQVLREAGGARVTSGEEELAAGLAELLGDAGAREAATAAALSVVADGQGALTRVIGALDPMLVEMLDRGGRLEDTGGWDETGA